MKGAVEACGCFPTGRHYPGIAHLLRIQAAGVADELAPDGSWADLPIAFIDTETTGRDASMDRIVEIGVILGISGEVKARHNWLINPGIPIPEAASQIHGITDDQVKDAPTFAEIIPTILDLLRAAIPAAYNASFDRGFLVSEMNRAGLSRAERLPPALRDNVEWLDPLVWARHIQKYEKGKTLSDVAARLGIPLENAHRAADDAEAALRVMYIFANDERVPKTYAAFMQEQRRLARLQEEDFKQWKARSS